VKNPTGLGAAPAGSPWPSALGRRAGAEAAARDVVSRGVVGTVALRVGRSGFCFPVPAQGDRRWENVVNLYQPAPRSCSEFRIDGSSALDCARGWALRWARCVAGSCPLSLGTGGCVGPPRPRLGWDWCFTLPRPLLGTAAACAPPPPPPPRSAAVRAARRRGIGGGASSRALAWAGGAWRRGAAPARRTAGTSPSLPSSVLPQPLGSPSEAVPVWQLSCDLAFCAAAVSATISSFSCAANWTSPALTWAHKHAPAMGATKPLEEASWCRRPGVSKPAMVTAESCCSDALSPWTASDLCFSLVAVAFLI